ncbi:hypothetical protein HK096_007076 [Nowakowskiella sp. JEL0078]|nr:hypothetical protein HK096_007076 [Nowakowskiella sp. JEL0078]
MTNCLGNRNHDGFLLGRTTVYSFNLDTEISADDIVAVFVSDGVKDVLNTKDIASVFLSIKNSVSRVSGKSLEKCEVNSVIDELVPLSCKMDTFDHNAKEAILDLIMDCDVAGNVDLQSACLAIVNIAMMRRSFDDLTCLAVQLPTKFGKGFDIHVRKSESRVASPGSLKHSFEISKCDQSVDRFAFISEIFVQSSESILRPFCLNWTAETDNKSQEVFNGAAGSIKFSPTKHNRSVDVRPQIDITEYIPEHQVSSTSHQTENQDNQYMLTFTSTTKRNIEIENDKMNDDQKNIKKPRLGTHKTLDFLDESDWTQIAQDHVTNPESGEIEIINGLHIDTQHCDVFSLPSTPSPVITSNPGPIDQIALVPETLQRDAVNITQITSLDIQILSDYDSLENIGVQNSNFDQNEFDLIKKDHYEGDMNAEILAKGYLAKEVDCYKTNVKGDKIVVDENDVTEVELDNKEVSIYSNSDNQSNPQLFNNNELLQVFDQKSVNENFLETQLDLEGSTQLQLVYKSDESSHCVTAPGNVDSPIKRLVSSVGFMFGEFFTHNEDRSSQ